MIAYKVDLTLLFTHDVLYSQDQVELMVVDALTDDTVQVITPNASSFEMEELPTPVVGYLHKVRVKGGYKILHTPRPRGKEAPIKGLEGVYPSKVCNLLIEHLSRNGWGRWLR